MAWDISKILIEHCPKTTLKSMLELIVAFKVLFFIIVGQLYSQDEKKKDMHKYGRIAKKAGLFKFFSFFIIFLHVSCARPTRYFEYHFKIEGNHTYIKHFFTCP